MTGTLVDKLTDEGVRERLRSLRKINGGTLVSHRCMK